MERALIPRALLSWIFAAAVLFVGVAASDLSAESPRVLAGLELETDDRIVFLGDSITHQCLYTQYVEDFFYTRFPGQRFRFHNAGVGGARAWDALQRFDRDVAAYKPKYVTVLLGMNDGSYRPFDQQTFDTYVRDMTKLVERIRAIGATPILMTPTMFDARAARTGNRQRDPQSVALYNSVLAYYGTWLREVATEQGVGFVDVFSPLNELTIRRRKTEPDFTLIRDAVHPDAPGQLVMAFAMIEDLGLRQPLSNIRITLDEQDKPTAKTSGGKIENLQATADSVAFTWLSNGLPWAVPDVAQSAAKELRLGHKASREALEIHGLQPGSYLLTIDGIDVGTYHSKALERHIELQGNTATPQYQQAKQVVDLNAQRNAGPIKDLRNEWRAFQQLARLKRQTESDSNEKLTRQVKQLEDRLANLDERIKKHEAVAMQLEDKIFELNQPRQHHYKISRVD